MNIYNAGMLILKLIGTLLSIKLILKLYIWIIIYNAYYEKQFL